VTNPYWCELDGVVFLGTSGQTIDDIYKYVNSEDRLKFAERTLHWRHIAPTAPDTLWCYPFQDVDPFIMSQAPHVYFISNQKEFATSTIEGPDKQRTRIILLPSFAETGVVVLVNLKNLKCHPIFFSSLN
ncbi:10224_t:CDS:2, partial [Acaulospora morrowiae]